MIHLALSLAAFLFLAVFAYCVVMLAAQVALAIASERERAIVFRLSQAHEILMTDADKIEKAIELLERLEAKCLVPNFAHDAMTTCPICRLLELLKAPSDQAK